jgi:hypothetical protein
MITERFMTPESMGSEASEQKRGAPKDYRMRQRIKLLLRLFEYLVYPW